MKYFSILLFYKNVIQGNVNNNNNNNTSELLDENVVGRAASSNIKSSKNNNNNNCSTLPSFNSTAKTLGKVISFTNKLANKVSIYKYIV